MHQGKNTTDNNLAKKGVCVRMTCATVYNQEHGRNSVKASYRKTLAVIAFTLGTATSVVECSVV